MRTLRLGLAKSLTSLLGVVVLTLAGRAEAGPTDLIGTSFSISSGPTYGYLVGPPFLADVAYNPLTRQFLVVWSDNRNASSTGLDIYGRLVSVDGSMGPEFPISTASGGQDMPTATYSPQANQFLVAWTDYRSGDADVDVYGQLVNSNGSLAGAEFPISTALGAQRFQDVGYDSLTNQFLVVWEDNRISTFDVFGRLINVNGTPASDEFRITAGGSSAGNVYRRALAYDPATDRFLVTFGQNYVSVGQFVSGTGALLGSNFSIGLPNAPTVTFSQGTRKFLVLANDDATQMVAQLLDANGNSVGGSFFITTPGVQLGTVIGYPPTGQFLAAWQDGRSSPCSYPDGSCKTLGRYVNPDATLAGGEFPIHAQGTGAFGLIGMAYSAETDRFLVVWADTQNGCCSIVGQLIGAPHGTFVATGSLRSPRSNHTATLLADGKVLIAGGHLQSPDQLQSDILQTAELFDSTNGTSIFTQSMTSPRVSHNAVRLQDGRMLIIGGSADGGTCTATSEIYEPVAGTWTATGDMVQARCGPTATLLADGRVLVTGSGNNVTSTAELYDPSTGKWSRTSDLLTGRRDHVAVRLANGKVLIVGGDLGYCCNLSSAELYDPAAGTWSSTGNVNVARAAPSAVLLMNGMVLLAGGDGDSGRLAHAELYDPHSGSWTTTGAMNIPRSENILNSTLLSDGTVLIVGGQDASGEVYDPSTGVWTLVGPTIDPARFAGSTSTRLGSGDVLLAGGIPGGSHASVNTAELYRVPVSVATPSGTNVSVSVNGARLTFTAVASAGETTVIRSSSGPTPPVGVSIGAPPTFYQITTTASFTAPITVCISYVGVTFSDPSNLTLQHYESGSWINVTTNLDTANMIVCGSVSSLSPFAIFQKPPSADLVIGKSGPGTVSSGSNLTYGIGVVNLGPNNATGVVVKDAIPAGTTFVSAQFAKGSCTVSSGKVTCTVSQPPTPCAYNNGIVTCSVGALGVFGSANPKGAGIQLVVKVTAKRGATITNTARVSSPTPDPKSANNSATATTSVR